MSPNPPLSYIAHPAGARSERACRAWARAGGILSAVATLLSMAYSAEWNLRMMLSDPLVWMTTLVAIAAGLVGGYALGVHLHLPADD